MVTRDLVEAFRAEFQPQDWPKLRRAAKRGVVLFGYFIEPNDDGTNCRCPMSVVYGPAVAESRASGTPTGKRFSELFNDEGQRRVDLTRPNHKTLPLGTQIRLYTSVGSELLLEILEAAGA